jgi:MoxR-like ATPase
MSDRQVSVDGHTHKLPQPFMVIATQNPYEFEGTYPLPESQLDRFLLCTKVGYPSRADELHVLSSHRRGEPVDRLEPALTCEQVLSLQEAVRQIAVNDALQQYLLDMVEATRGSNELHVGVSTRGALCLYRASQALAFVEGRQYVVPDDLKRLAVPVMSHRVITKGYLHSGQRGAVESLIQRLIDDVAVPR